MNISPVNNIQNPQKEVRTQIFYFNDVHGVVEGAEKIKIASDVFDSSTQGRPVDALKLCAGDVLVGQNYKKDQLMAQFLNLLNLDAYVFGNHELDNGANSLSKIFEMANFKTLVANLKLSAKSRLNTNVQQKKLLKSDIIEKNGNKYGIIGLMPPDVLKRISITAQKDCCDLTIDTFEQTKQDLRDEIKQLKEKGVNKIILLSHLGADKEAEVAKTVDGIDVIVGGHSHDEFDGVKPGVNYFTSPSGNPVIMTQAGKNGQYYGVLDVEFDNAGKIKAATNKITKTQNTPKSLIFKWFEDRYLGSVQIIGKLKNNPEMVFENQLGESPIMNLVSDAVKVKSGAQIVFFNTGTVKGELKAGEITDRKIYEALPYFNRIKTYKLTEKDIIDALNGAIQATINPPHRIGTLQVSGMKYTVGKDMKVKDVFVINPDKTLTKLDDQKPSTEKTFTVAYNTYLEGGPERIEMLNAPNKVVQNFEWTDTEATVEYIKSIKEPFSLNKEGRINLEA